MAMPGSIWMADPRGAWLESGCSVGVVSSAGIWFRISGTLLNGSLLNKLVGSGTATSAAEAALIPGTVRHGLSPAP